MALDTISQPVIFEVCRRILEREIKPIHYRVLTEKALKELQFSEVNMQRQIEDVREQFAKRPGVRYMGAPYCLFYLDEWITKNRPPLFNFFPPTRIATSVNFGLRACFEGIMRSPHILNKHNVTSEKHAWMIARGLYLQEHVVGWFKNQWPNYVGEPENYCKWDQWSSHDFKLLLPKRELLVDVAGKNTDGTWNPLGKQTTDIHVLGSINTDEDAIFIHGFKPGTEWTQSILGEETEPIQSMAFYLNTQSMALDYDLFRNGAS